MIAGHFALGLAAKRVVPYTSVGTLQLASATPDLLAFLFLILGVEHARVVPGITAYFYFDAFDIAISHSLVMDVMWGALFGFVYRMRQGSWRGVWMVMGLVVSHWVLDAVSHRPEMPIAPGLPQRVGLGLWNSLAATFAVEGAMWSAAIAIYVRATVPRRPAGTYLLCVLVAVLTLMWIAIPFVPPPTNLRTTAVRNLVFFSVTLAAFSWLDRLRAFRDELPPVKVANC